MDTTDPIDFEARRAAMMEERIQEDYFAFGKSVTHTLPDGVSIIEIRVMNEGEKRKYLNAQNRELVMNRATQDTKLKMAPGDERYNLLKAGIKDWNLRAGGSPVPFNSTTLDTFLSQGDPKIMDGIEKAIRLANPWLLSEMTLEDIDEEIKSLQELRAKKVEEDEGKGASSAK